MAIYSGQSTTREVAKGTLPAYRLVSSTAGKIDLNGADTKPFGAITESGSVDASTKLPKNVRVHSGQSIVPVETADAFAEGDDVFAAADGKVAKTGSVKVGIADGESYDSRGVKTVNVNLTKN